MPVNRYPLTEDLWILVALGPSTVVLQPEGNNSVLLAVASAVTSTIPSGQILDSFELQTDNNDGFSLSLGEGESLYARASGEKAVVKVLITEVGGTNQNGLITDKLRLACETNPLTDTRVTVATGTGDIVTNDGNAAAASYWVISKDPLSDGTETRIQSISSWELAIEASIGLSLSQRTVGQEFSVEFVSDEDAIPLPADLAISSIQQAASVLTVTTATAHGLRPGMRIGIRGVANSRLNYSALVVATTPSTTRFTATAGPAGTIPSVTAGPFTAGFVYYRSALGGAPNGSSMLFENASATNASFYVRSESGDVLPSATLVGNHSITLATTASVQAINAALTYAFQPTNEYRFTQAVDCVQWADVPVDSISAHTNRYKITKVVPDIDQKYRLRLRAVNSKSLTRPNAQIISAVKSGATTATITTDVPHGLTVTDLVNIYGIRNQAAASFPNLAAATAVLSVPTTTTFTINIGTASTVTSYGGYVSRVNGGQVQQGAIAQVAQSISRTSNIVTVVGSAAWSGLLIGDYINLVGVRNAVDGGTLSLDGAYRVRDIATTSLVLEPIGSTVTGADIASVNCGGAVIKRTDLRISFVRCMRFDRQRIEIMPRPTSDESTAVPVSLKNAVSVSSGTVAISSGTVTTVSTVSTVSAITGGGVAENAVAGANPVLVGGVVRTAAAPATLVAGDAARDTMTAAGAKTIALGAPVASVEVASAARTATGNSGTISVPTGGSISGNIVVSAVSGTSPTLDLTLEESYNNGTTWTQVWAAPRFTAAGNTLIPAMLITGLRRWVWTISGTTPSFTFAINTNQLTIPATIIRKLFDRTAGVLTGTLSAVTAALPIHGCRQVTAKVSIAAATTPATYQFQVSDDGATWTNVGSATPAVANSQVAFSIPQGTVADFARVIVTVAGSAQTGNFVSIQASV